MRVCGLWRPARGSPLLAPPCLLLPTPSPTRMLLLRMLLLLSLLPLLLLLHLCELERRRFAVFGSDSPWGVRLHCVLSLLELGVHCNGHGSLDGNAAEPRVGALAD